MNAAMILPAPARKRRVFVVQQSVWQTEGHASMPLAAGYLKAVIDQDPVLGHECEVRIFNFSGGERISEIVLKLFRECLPDALCFSVVGWNYSVFGRVAATFRQLNPQGWVIWGGTHVANQAARVFAEWPAVDIISNGEGEVAFPELISALLAGRARTELHSIKGISFRDPQGVCITTERPGRIKDLNIIPSPILTGALALTNDSGHFAYDYALLETNRGCPYSCAFCYWGGAIGQKVRKFSIDRLAEEIEYLARLQVANIMLCDANFGILPEDEEFVELCIKARERYGYPRHVMTSWAKNKGARFHRIVRRMKQTGFHSSFNLALQSLDETVLEAMGRKNMPVNEWESLAQWLQAEGLDLYAELIWGCPGETVEGFLAGYDKLARTVNHIAIYPHLIMPNTRYSEERDKHGLITWRPTEHDFELVLAHSTMSIEDNRRMHRFLFWARTIAEHLYFRALWAPLYQLAQLTQSQILLSIDRWIDAQTHSPAAMELRNARDSVVDSLEASAQHIESGLQCLYGRAEIPELLQRWWREEVLPLVPDELTVFFAELLRFELLTLPLYGARAHPVDCVESRLESGATVYIRQAQAFTFDIESITTTLRQGRQPVIEPQATVYDITYRAGFCNDMRLYHNAHNLEFFGKARAAHASP